MLILGIDPGSRSAGWGIIEEKEKTSRVVAFGVVKPPPVRELPPRLKHLFEAFTEIIDTHSPDEVAVESVFFAENAKSALMLGQALAAAILPGLAAGIPLYEYSALQVKKAATGRGHARKDQVAEMVCRLLSLKQKPKPQDVTDALAVALCHIHSSPMMKKTAFK